MLSQNLLLLQNQIGVLNESQEVAYSKFGELEQKIFEAAKGKKEDATVKKDHPTQELPIAQPAQIFINTGLKDDCRYTSDATAPNKPKQCIILIQGPDGMYGTCTIGAQVREQRVAPWFLTSAISKVGCVSRSNVNVCKFLKYERAKI